jgi:hypothetical protein
MGSGKWEVEMRSGRGKWGVISEKQEELRRGRETRKGEVAVDNPQAHDEARMLMTSHFTLHT